MESKTPVEIIQELIAIHTTRKEVIEKIKTKEVSKDSSDKVIVAGKQSDQFINELLSELSNYGDGVMSVVERENEYHRIWKTALENFDTATPDEINKLFLSLESSLKNFYREVVETQADIPPSIIEIINKQFVQL